VGANVGFFTLLASRLVGPTGHVVAIEPLARNLSALERTLLINDVRNVQVCPYALAETSGEEHFDEGASPSCAHLSDRGGKTVRVATLDDVLSDLGIGAPRLVKIDVEGAESRVLQGATRTLSGARAPSLIIATHGWQEHERCLALLGNLGVGPLDEHIDSGSGNGRVLYLAPRDGAGR